MIPSTGTLRYAPTLRNGSTARRDGGSTEWWLILDCDPELGRLLRHQYAVWHRHARTLQPPLWGAHVSVVRGEEPPDKAGWKRWAGREVGFEYAPEPCETDGYLWVPVRSPVLLDVRGELGLPPEPTPGFHLTFGNLKHGGGVTPSTPTPASAPAARGR
jgi:hypothetical protein